MHLQPAQQVALRGRKADVFLDKSRQDQDFNSLIRFTGLVDIKGSRSFANLEKHIPTFLCNGVVPVNPSHLCQN